MNEPVAGDVASVLTSKDAKDLREFTRLRGSFERSTHGSMMEHAKYNGALRDGMEVTTAQAYPKASWPRVEGGEIVSERAITARPNKGHGDASVSAGYDMTSDQSASFANVSNRLVRLAGVRVGGMNHSAALVFDVFMRYSTENDDLSQECDCDNVAHLTVAFAALAMSVRGEAADVIRLACRRHNLKGKEAAFVAAVDLKRPDGRNFAAVTAGYDPAKAHAIANELSSKPGIEAAIKMREKAAVIAALTNDWQLLLELRSRRATGGLTPSHVKDMELAEEEAEALMGEACRAWNGARAGGAR